MRDPDYLPSLHHSYPQMSGGLVNNNFEAAASSRMSVYGGIAPSAHAH